MREILFRGKDIKDIWHIGLLGHIGNAWYIISNSAGVVTAFKVVPETVGQFTGLTDKNSKKIFEGDIVRYADFYDYNCYLESLDNVESYDNIDFGDIWTVDEVVYCAKIGYPAFDLNKHDFEINGLSELNESGQYYYEIIGNIHDNPELLKGE